MKRQPLYRQMVTRQDWITVGLILLGVVLVSVLFVFVLDKSQQNKISGITAQNKDLEKQIQEATVKKNRIKELRDDMDKTSQLVVEFERRLPSDRDITTLITEFEGIGAAIGLRPDVSPLQVVRQGNTEVIPFRVKAQGPFHAIARFINELERAQRYLKVTELNIKTEKNGVPEAIFILSTYRFLESAPAGAGAAAQPGSAAKPGGAS